MPIEVKTVYTKEMLLRFNDFLALRKRALWIIMILGTAAILYMCIHAALIIGWNSELVTYTVLILAWDALFLFLNFGLPRITVKRAPNLNAEVNYVFSREHIEVNAQSTYSTDQSIIRYGLVNKAFKTGGYLYLLLTWNRGFLVDLSSLSNAQTAELRLLLESKLPAKKIKWKI